MNRDDIFVPVKRPLVFPMGKDGHNVSQIEFYSKLTDVNCDLRDIAAVVEPVIQAAQIEPLELSDLITIDE
jgi:hypothetical protein